MKSHKLMTNYCQNNNQWKSDNIWESLLKEYELAVHTACSVLKWYEEKQKWKRISSKTLRASAILCAAIGTICPLLDAAELFKNSGLVFGQAGYIAFAMAGAFVGADRFFGVSSAWMRFMMTRLEIERKLKTFRLDWLMAVAEIKGECTSEHAKILLQRIKEFTLAVHDIVKKETEFWAAEFQSNLAELEKMVKTEMESVKPGDVSVTLTNASDFDNEFTLSFPGRADEIIKGSSALISDVPPGNYNIRVSGKKGEKLFTDTKIAEVKPGRLEKVNFELPLF